MATTGQLITRSSFVNDFIAKVMDPVRFAPGAYHTGNVPTVNIRLWDNGTIINVAPYTGINVSQLGSNSYPLPTTSDVPGPLVLASEILNFCRVYATDSTRLRRVIWGVFYTQYYNGQYTQTGVPSDNPYAHANGVITGSTFGLGDAHLTSAYRLGLASPITNQPTSQQVISAPNINDFYDKLRAAVLNAQTNANNLGLPDLRICHSSCHNNCHGSRGRR